MRRPREGEPSPMWRRIQTIMKVQLGQSTVAQAARELGISPKHYYRLEERILGAALGAVVPRKRGPRPGAADPKLTELEKRMAAADRERELLKVKVQHLEDVNRALQELVHDPEGGKKKRRRVQRGVSADDARIGGDVPRPGKIDPGTVRGSEPSGRDVLPLEGGSGSGKEQAGPSRPGP